MSLRNTEYIYGVVIFTGHETKIMKNNSQAKYKFSKLEVLLNRSVFIIFLVQCAISLSGAIFGNLYRQEVNTKHSNHSCNPSNIDCQYDYYLELPTNPGGWTDTIIRLTGTWILIFTNFIPISMMVTFEIVKLWQASFMADDLLMFD